MKPDGRLLFPFSSDQAKYLWSINLDRLPPAHTLTFVAHGEARAAFESAAAQWRNWSAAQQLTDTAVDALIGNALVELANWDSTPVEQRAGATIDACFAASDGVREALASLVRRSTEAGDVVRSFALATGSITQHVVTSLEFASAQRPNLARALWEFAKLTGVEAPPTKGRDLPPELRDVPTEYGELRSYNRRLAGVVSATDVYDDIHPPTGDIASWWSAELAAKGGSEAERPEAVAVGLALGNLAGAASAQPFDEDAMTRALVDLGHTVKELKAVTKIDVLGRRVNIALFEVLQHSIMAYTEADPSPPDTVFRSGDVSIGGHRTNAPGGTEGTNPDADLERLIDLMAQEAQETLNLEAREAERLDREVKHL